LKDTERYLFFFIKPFALSLRIFEGIPFDFALSFAKIIKIIMFASFYSYAYPFIVFLSMGNLIVAYWVDKFVLLRICVTPGMLSGQLSYAMSDLFLEFFIVIFNVKNYRE